MWISRHGTANDDDELIFNDFPCGETVSFHYIQDTDKCFSCQIYLLCFTMQRSNIVLDKRLCLQR